MAFQLERRKPVPKEIRKVVQKRLDKALRRLEGHERSLSDAGVHDARKRFKEIRSTLRLVRAELGEQAFKRENRALRDAGRPLSTLRDAKVLVDLRSFAASLGSHVRQAIGTPAVAHKWSTG